MSENTRNIGPAGPPRSTTLQFANPSFSTANILYLKISTKSADGNMIRYYVMHSPEPHDYRILLQIVTLKDSRRIEAFDGQKRLLFYGTNNNPVTKVYYPNDKPMGIVDMHRNRVIIKQRRRDAYLNFEENNTPQQNLQRLLYKRDNKRDAETSVVEHALGLMINFLPETHDSAHRVVILVYALKLCSDFFGFSDNILVPTELLQELSPIPLLPAGFPLFDETWWINKCTVAPRCAEGRVLYSDIIDNETRQILLVLRYDPATSTGQFYNQCGTMLMSYTNNTKRRAYGERYIIVHMFSSNNCLLGEYDVTQKKFGELRSRTSFELEKHREHSSVYFIKRCQNNKRFAVATIGCDSYGGWDGRGRPSLTFMQTDLEPVSSVQQAMILVVFCRLSATYYKNVHSGIPTLKAVYRKTT